MSYVGFKIGNKHTYTDWGLRCLDYQISFPKSQKSLLQVPGRNGKINIAWEDQKEAYEHREIKIVCDAPDKSYTEWTNIVSEIANYAQDEYLTITPDFDQGFYYIGWVSIAPSKDFKVGSEIVFNIDAEPYKLKASLTTVSLEVSGETTVTLSNAKKKVQPEISTDANMTIIIDDNEYSCSAGESGVYVKANFFLPAGSTVATIEGTGNMTIRYQEAKL